MDSSGRPSAPRTWLPEFLLLSQQRLRAQMRVLGLATLVGVVAGLAAVAFYTATQVVFAYTLSEWAGYTSEPHPAGEPPLAWLPAAADSLHIGWLVLWPAIGGLAAGILIYTFAPEAEGHGTDSVIAAYHLHGGYLRARVPLVKMVASALTIGTGGSGGREGPIAQIGAGFGSVLSDLLRLRPAERRVLLAAGMGAGIGAIFRAPLAGALFAAEVLYCTPEFEAEVILPAALASVIAYCTFGSIFGWTPLFATPELSFDNAWQLFPYLLLALFMVLLASAFTRTFYATTAAFKRLPIPRHFRPAIGATATAVIGLVLYFSFGRDLQALAVLAAGYGGVQAALSEGTAVGGWLLLAIAVGKILTTSLTIGSGGSGGVFGPSMVIGGCGGGALGVALHHWWPALVPQPASFVIVGMAGFFAAAAKTPFSTLIMVSEMTGGYQLLLPALWVCTLSFMLSDSQSIYASQVEGPARSPAHQGRFLRQALAGVQVSQLVEQQSASATVLPGARMSEIVARFEQAGESIVPVVDQSGSLVGIIEMEEMYLAAQASGASAAIVAEDLMRSTVAPLISADSLERASELFVENNLPALPVVDSLHDKHFIGIVRRNTVARAYLQRLASGEHTDSAPSRE